MHPNFSLLLKPNLNVMSNESIIQLFEGVNIRMVWDEKEQEYYFAVADIVQVLTDTANPRDYIKKMLKRDEELKFRWGTICPPTRMEVADGNRGINLIEAFVWFTRRVME